GGIPMPLIVEYTYSDGSSEQVTYPPEIWRKNDAEFMRVISSQAELVSITVDPRAETADIDVTNNSWPKKESPSEFNQFKEGIKGD
ncbi:MAG: M1 family peptidase, partial [Flavobacteriaceae bacterium]|nr:M1 family peptidase [Muriicola sp.]NNL40205.1 M1 family peptidase [Flavobacteriaceae bacterium]